MFASALLTTRAGLCFAIVTTCSIASVDAQTMTLRWDPNPGSVLGYRVSWGTSSGQYPGTVDVGNQTSFQFEGPTPPTIYYFIVTAYDSAGNQSAPSAEVNTGPWPAPLTLANIDASPSAPQVAGTTITFQAVAAGGITPLQYKWLIFDGTTWSTGAEWSPSNTFAWRSVLPNADYRVGVWVRSSTGTQDAPDNAAAGSSIPFAITGPGGTLPTISFSEVAPQPAHTAIKFTANVPDGGKYRYKWWVFDGVSWNIEKEWGTHNTFTWTPSAPNANYRILVRVQNVADPMDTGGTSIQFPIVSKDVRRRVELKERPVTAPTPRKIAH